jgi:hypothetical protein
MESFKKFFGCGNTYINRTTINFTVTNFKEIYTIVIPFFKKYKIIGVKHLDFLDWVKVANIINKKRHLTKEGFDEIIRIKGQMNSKR